MKPSPIATICDDWTVVSAGSRERSESVISSMSTYSYPSSSCTDDAWSVVEYSSSRKPIRSGRHDEEERLESALAASLKQVPNPNKPKAKEVDEEKVPGGCFFSSTGASIDLQLRVAASVTSVSCLNALHATCKWVRRCVWLATTQKFCIDSNKARQETLPLAEAAAAVILLDQLGFSTILPPTTQTAGYAKRYALSRAVALFPPKQSPCLEYLTVTHKTYNSLNYHRLLNDRHTTRHRNNTEQILSSGEDMHGSKLPTVRKFESPYDLQHAADKEVLGLVALRGSPDGSTPWRAFLLDIHKNGACRLSFPPNFDGWTRAQAIRRIPFPVVQRKENQLYKHLMPRLDIERWRTFVCTDDNFHALSRETQTHLNHSKKKSKKCVSSSNLPSLTPLHGHGAYYDNDEQHQQQIIRPSLSSPSLFLQFASSDTKEEN
uniref:Uncharacterized protein n=1 Tax=Aureoumbra lagunensis TaxID=44058 RepID=A0A6S8CEQ4_9STRA